MTRKEGVASEVNRRADQTPVDAGAHPRPRGRPRGAKTRLLREGSGELGRHHFAFLRALLDDVDLERAWRLYLSFTGGPSDRRHFATRLRLIVAAIEHAGVARGCGSELAVALPALRALPDFAGARAGRGAGKAGHISTPDVALAPASSQPPSPNLEEWRSQYCGATGIDEDFYTEAEWLELYGEEFGEDAASGQMGAGKSGHSAALPSPALSATTHSRLAEGSPGAATPRLSKTQSKAIVEALAALERVLSREATLEDETGFWLGSGIPRDLAKVGVNSLGDLVNYINIYGFRWHRRVHRMGVVRARRLLDWLTPIAEAGGQPFNDSARRPETDLAMLRRRELASRGVTGAEPFALVPIVGGALSDALSGRQGAFRSHEANVWGAETDVQAISQWLSRYQGQTRREYTRIAERFYLWCIHVRHKALSSLQEPDLQAYQAFLAAPPADWVQERKVRREDASWRPFRGPLGRNSQRHEFTVLGSMFSDMHKNGYLRANAMANLGRTLGLLRPSIDVRRSLSERQWAFAMEVLHEKPDTPERRRLQLLLELGSTTGLRLSELATTRLKGFRRALVDGQEAWLLDVIGKGGKPRTVMVFDEIKTLLDRHHQDMNAAGLGFDSRVTKVQTANSLPTTAAGERMAGTGHVVNSSLGEDVEQALQDALQAEHQQAWRPLVGILKRPPPRRNLDRLGVPFLDREQPSQADRYGALERSAIYKTLRRFFREVAVAAAARDGAPGSADFLNASTHWLRHTFANSAVRQMQPQVLQSLLGHSDLRVTSVYVKADAVDLVRGMRAMQRAAESGPERAPRGRVSAATTTPKKAC